MNAPAISEQDRLALVALEAGMSERDIAEAIMLSELPEAEFEKLRKSGKSREDILKAAKKHRQDAASASSLLAQSEPISTRRTNGKSAYKPSPIRIRRSKVEMQNALEAIQNILNAEESEITIRHLFYRLVGLKVIEKTEQAYKNLGHHLAKWRRAEEIQWSAFADNTRWHIRSETFDSVEDALNNTVETYRRNLWSTQPFYIEVWVEKDAIASIVSGTANRFGVPVFVCRGFASLSSLYSAANTFREATQAGKRAIIYHFGDYDPSGVAAGESIASAFRDDFNVDVEFTRAAVTKEQIQELNLPTRPVKKSDSRAKKWTGGECVEIDTMAPADIRQLVQSCIIDHISIPEWKMLHKTEEMERETMRTMFRRAA